tara:strand:- start:77 stop:577 length:501 start_codon:yes stop_codon:yes gene_type:complete
MKALFITLEELKRKSIIDGNLDTDKLIQFVEVAQDVYIQTQLGTKLYDQLQSEVINNNLTTANSTLLDNHIKKMLIWFSQAEYMKYAAFQISNGGVFKHRSENSDSATLEEINDLIASTKTTADFYTQRFLDFMDQNTESYPLYTAAQDGGMYPERDQNMTGWNLN